MGKVKVNQLSGNTFPIRSGGTTCLPVNLIEDFNGYNRLLLLDTDS